MRLENQVAVITGGAGGVGRETGLRSAPEGADCGTVDLHAANGAAAVGEIKPAAGPPAGGRGRAQI